MSINRRITVLAIVAVLLALLIMVNVSTGDDGANMPLPADMCYQDGKPIIYSSVIDGHGIFSLSYLNASGQLITQRYSHPAFSNEWVVDVKVVMDGAVC